MYQNNEIFKIKYYHVVRSVPIFDSAKRDGNYFCCHQQPLTTTEFKMASLQRFRGPVCNAPVPHVRNKRSQGCLQLQWKELWDSLWYICITKNFSHSNCLLKFEVQTLKTKQNFSMKNSILLIYQQDIV